MYGEDQFITLNGKQYRVRYDINAMAKVETLLGNLTGQRVNFMAMIDPIYTVRELVIMLYAGMNGAFPGAKEDHFSMEAVQTLLQEHMNSLQDQNLEIDSLIDVYDTLKVSLSNAARIAVGFTKGIIPLENANPGPTKKAGKGGSKQD
jgi:hypothetical protein